MRYLIKKKLNWFSSQHLKDQDSEKVLTAIRVIEPDWGKNRNKNFCLNVIKLMVVRSNSLLDIITGSVYFFKSPKVFEAENLKTIWNQSALVILKDIINLYKTVNSWDRTSLEKTFKDYIDKNNYGFGQVMKPMRLSLCGSLTGPSLFELMELLGNQEILNRLKYAINQIELNE